MIERRGCPLLSSFFQGLEGAAGDVSCSLSVRQGGMKCPRSQPPNRATKTARIVPTAMPSCTTQFVQNCQRGAIDPAWSISGGAYHPVEGIEEDALVSAVVTDEIERSNTVVIASDSLTIDDARARAQAGERINDQWKGRVKSLPGRLYRRTRGPSFRAIIR